MAIVVENTGATTVASSTNTIAVTKPTGLAVGDLMIAHVYARNATTTTFNSVASGFTEIEKEVVVNIAHGAWWKIADSSDVAASTFTFGWDGAAVNGLGRMWRISGHHATTPINTSTSANGSDPITFSGITPGVANCLIVLLHAANDDTGSVSHWAITTDNPTWTEAYDVNGGLSNALIAGAWALRAQTTATGNITWTQATNESCSMMAIAVAPSAVDSTPPTASGWATNTAGTTITATLSESGCTPSSGTGGFTLGGTSATVASWTISSTTLTLTLSGTVTNGQTVTVSYDDAATSDDIMDAATNKLADISSAAVTNNVPASGNRRRRVFFGAA